ncbi:MAG: GNAT family protein [Bacillota bacterium]|jgi:RimJ/RimL family protein N-acetyltransferase|nr:GNAT family protein [Bacillota bacterium]HHT91323.1 GNAT family N-acetyltransferase [Bacillota bacterium]
MDLTFRKVDLGTALEIISWEYPPPYQIYGFQGSALALAVLIDHPYLAALAQGQLVGFFCFGRAAQVRNKGEHLLYQDERYLDVGLGMHPNWCGKGLGPQFLYGGLLYAKERDWLGGFRLTVAADNVRAQKVYLRLGFREAGRIVQNSGTTPDYLVMTLDTLGPRPPTSPAR